MNIYNWFSITQKFPLFTIIVVLCIRRQIIQSILIISVFCIFRCETRPGPEFLIRKYIFNGNLSFTLLQWYYSDEWCTKPLYSLQVEGTYIYEHPAWTIPNAMEVQYLLNKVQITTYTNTVAKEIASR